MGQVATVPTVALGRNAHLSEGELGKGMISGAGVGVSRYPLAGSLVTASQSEQGERGSSS